MNNIQKFTGILLILSMLITVLTFGGCIPSNAPTPEQSEEVLGAVTELYEKSLILNEYIFGNGLPVSDTEAGEDGKVSPLYVDVAEESPYKTEAEFERAILSVYSESYYEESLSHLLFDGYEVNKDYAPRYKERKGVLQFDVTSEPQFSDLSGRFDIPTAKVISVSSDTAIVECNYSRGDYSAVCTLTLDRTSNGWRFSVPTF